VHVDVPNFQSREYVAGNLRRVNLIQEYFEQRRGLDVMDAEDGEVVGRILSLKSAYERFYRKKGEDGIDTKVRLLVEKYRGLREARAKWPWFGCLVTRVLRNRLRPAKYVGEKLCSLSGRDATLIGGGLAISLASNLSAKAGVDDWILRYRALQTLDKEAEWFRPMIEVVAQALLEDVPWGLKARVTVGAVLSTMDMASDLYVVVQYLGAEETEWYGVALLCCILSSLLVQLMGVLMQNGMRNKKALFKEVVVVLLALKPAFDAKKMISETKKEDHHLLEPKSEIMFTKVAELVCESVPGAILQAYVLVGFWSRRERVGKASIASMLVSALTSGFISACISYDYDVDPVERKRMPLFYGYIPDGGKRTLMFLALVANSSLLLLMRGLSAACLLLVGEGYFVIYAAGEMGLYLAMKCLRGDFWYWVPVNGVAGFVVSLLARVLLKVVTDYTGVVQFRHPGELGGLFWTVNMGLAVCGVIVSVHLFRDKFAGERELDGLRTLVSGLVLGWAVSFGLIVGMAKKEYRGTFMSTKTGWETQIQLFRDGKSDEVKCLIVDVNHKVWASAREDVKAWVLTGWWRWTVEKPVWYTESWRAQLPDDMIPMDDEEGEIERDSARATRKTRKTMRGAGGTVGVAG